jgi:heme/copper-type cytochrome/quinol oxidase subunit 2
MNDSMNSNQSKNPIIIGAILIALVIVGAGIVMTRKSNTASNSIATNQITSTTGPNLDSTTDMDADGDEPLASNDTSMEANPTSSVMGATDDSTAQVIAVEGGSFYYKPNEIHVKAGQPVKITLTSKDMMHDFNIDELGVKIPVTKAGASNSVEFTPTKTGTFEFYCSVGNHRAQGQIGTIYVE